MCQSGKSVLIRFQHLTSRCSARENFCFACILLLRVYFSSSRPTVFLPFVSYPTHVSYLFLPCQLPVLPSFKRVPEGCSCLSLSVHEAKQLLNLERSV
jgi:hypothetical protein